MDSVAQQRPSKSKANDDIISNMPLDIILLIMSFLSYKETMQTSVISKKWKSFLTSITNIDVDVIKELWVEKEKLMEDCSMYLDWVFANHDDSSIRRLHIGFDKLVDSVRLDSWLQAAVAHNVQELDLDVAVDWGTWPSYIFTCRSLVVLKLSGFTFFTLSTPESTCLINLKKLHLFGFKFEDISSLKYLLDNCPILDELELAYCKWVFSKNITISIPGVRSLCIVQDSEEEMTCIIQIYAPNLTKFSLISDLRGIFCICSPCSINSAILLVSYEMRLRNSAINCAHLATSLFSAVKDVTYLEISSDIFMVMKDANGFDEQLHIFVNLTHLKVTNFSSRQGGLLMDFLWKVPKLEFLKIEEGFGVVTDETDNGDNGERKYNGVKDSELIPEKVPPCFQYNLHMLTISYFHGTDEEMRFVGFILANATVLQKLNIYLWEYFSTKYVEEIKDELNILPRSSESCDLAFY